MKLLHATFACSLAAFALFGAAPDDIQRAERLRTAGSAGPARAIYESLIPTLRNGNDRNTLATALEHLSEIDLVQGKYPAAVSHSTECTEIVHQLGSAVDEVSCRGVEGRARVALGEYDAALKTYRLGLDVAKSKSLGEAQVALLNNIGNVQYFLGRYDDARRDYEEAERILASNASAAWFTRRRVITLSNHATLYQRLGQYGKALALYATLRETSQSLLGREQTQMLVNMGTLYRRLGDPVKALATYDTAQQSMGTPADPATQIAIAKNAGIALALDLGRFDEARTKFEEALAIATKSGNRREMVQAMLYLGETELRLQHWAKSKSWFAQALPAARGMSVAEDEWKCLYGLGRVEEAQGGSAALAYFEDAIRSIEGIRAGAGAPAMRVGFLADKRDVYDAAIRVLLRRAEPPVRDVFRLIEQAKARSFQDAVPRLKGADLEHVAAALNPDALVLDYWLSESQLAIVWIRHSGWGIVQGAAPTAHDLEALGQELSAGTGGRWRPLAAAVAPKLLPVPLKGASTLIVIPDGALQLLPFDVLPTEHNRILIEEAAVSYLPAAALLEPDVATTLWRAPWHLQFTGFADPKAPASGALFLPDAAPLPGSETEVRTAAAALGGRASLHTGADDLKRYLNAAAPVLHLATHAIADAEDAERSRILFSGPEYLFAREIYKLRLNGVALAVLSACDTERGASIRGDGVQSFSRAFLAAGASSTITTLWKIGDRTSAEFWQRFYAHAAKGETVSRALQNTKLEFYRAYSGAQHPKYWSVFALNGAPGTRVPRAIPWTAFAAALALAFCAVAMLWKRRKS